jgi:drug/metabolite transporter (DMT)-like permease
MISASLMFACMAAFIKLAAQHGAPLAHIVFFRGLLSLVLLYGVLRYRGAPLQTPHWRAHLSRSVIGFSSMILFFAALKQLPVGMAVTLNYTSPVLLGLFLLVMHRERPHQFLIAAMLGGMCGVLLLLRPTYDSSQLFGIMLAIGSAVATALSALNIRALSNLREPAWRIVFYFSLFVTAGSLPWYLLSDPATLNFKATAYLLAVGVSATAGQLMYTQAYQQGHTQTVSLLGYSQVVFTSLLGFMLWHDALTWLSWLGIALVIASGILASSTANLRTATDTPAQ